VPKSACHILSTDIPGSGKKPVFLDMANYTTGQEESYYVSSSRLRLIRDTPLSLSVFSVLHCILQHPCAVSLQFARNRRLRQRKSAAFRASRQPMPAAVPPVLCSRHARAKRSAWVSKPAFAATNWKRSSFACGLPMILVGNA
jgi:hypothetical protein